MEKPMTTFKTIGAIVILSAAIASPVFAQEAIVSEPAYSGPAYPGPTYHGRAYDRQNFRGAYGQSNAPYYAAPLTSDDYWNMENFGISGRDPSRVGGQSPWLNPPS
jgi:hypothetical protein